MAFSVLLVYVNCQDAWFLLCFLPARRVDFPLPAPTFLRIAQYLDRSSTHKIKYIQLAYGLITLQVCANTCTCMKTKLLFFVYYTITLLGNKYVFIAYVCCCHLCGNIHGLAVECFLYCQLDSLQYFLQMCYRPYFLAGFAFSSKPYEMYEQTEKYTLIGYHLRLK